MQNFTTNNGQVWDNKFGMIEKPCGFQAPDDKCGYAMPDSMIDCTHKGVERSCPAFIPSELAPMVKPMIEGVGQDAEIITNAAGGKQSKSPMAMHLVDPKFLEQFASNKAEELEYLDEGDSTCIDEEDVEKHSCYRAIERIADFMQTGMECYLQMALDTLEDEIQQLITIAKVLQYGADRYEPNNWRLIPQEEHINHALIHLVAAVAGDTQDDHIDHALCRLMMALSTKQSEGFSYTRYIPKTAEVA